MKVINNFVLQGQQTIKDSKIHLDKVYNFPNNSFITDITITLQPLTDGLPIFQNINTGNTILVQSLGGSTSDYTSIPIPNGAYTIDQLSAQINNSLALYNVTLDIIIKGNNFGKAKLTTNRNIQFHKAPDLIKVFKFKQFYSKGTYVSDGIIDITTGCQTLNVYSSIIKSAPQSVSHSANNLLCSFSIKDLTKPNTQHFTNVFIPVHQYNNFVDFILTSVETNQKVNFNAILNVYINISTIQTHIKTDTIEDAIQLNLINTTNITIPINNPHTTINFNNDIQLPNNSYITRLSLLADAKIHNITSTQIVVIDGAQIIFNPGTWDINQLMDKLNTGNAIFNLVISGKDTYKVHITDFQSIDFSNAHQIKNILGIEDDQMSGINIVKQYPVNDTNNKVVVSDGDSAISNVVIPNGNYSFDDYLSMLESKLRLSTPLVSIDQRSDKYVQFNFSQYIKFVRDQSNLNGWFNDFNQYFDSCVQKTVGLDEEFYIPQDTTFTIELLNSSESYSGTVSKGYHKPIDILNRLCNLINTTGYKWLVRNGNLIARNNDVPRVNVTWSHDIGYKVVNTSVHRFEVYYQRVCRKGVRYCDGTTNYTFNSTENFVHLDSPISIRTNINIESTQQVFSNDYSIAAGDYSFDVLAKGIIDNVNSLYGKTMLSGTANKMLYKVDLVVSEAVIQFNDGCGGSFLNFINLPQVVTEGFIMGVFVGNGWLTGSLTVPAGTQFTFIRQEEEESGVEPHVFTLTQSSTCTNGGASSGLLSKIRGLIGSYYNSIGGDFSIPSFLIYGKAHCSSIRAGGSYGVFKFGRAGEGSPELLDYVTLPETFLSSEWYVFNKVNPTFTLPKGYYTQEEECSYVKSSVESLNVWGTVINKPCWSTVLERRIQRITGATCCSLTSHNPLWLVCKPNGPVFNTGLYTNVNLHFIDPNEDISMYTNQIDYTGPDGTSWMVGFTSQPTTQEDCVEQMNAMFASKGLAISWKKQETCYSIVADEPFKLGGSFFSNSLLKSIKPGHNQTSQVWTWNYYNDAVYEISGYETIMSKKVINITNSKEVAKVYCDLVKSYHSCDCLLTNLHIVDLKKNYSSLLELIPIKTSFRTISVKVRDLDDKDYSFAGTIYLNMLISSLQQD